MDAEATSCKATVGDAPWTTLHVVAVADENLSGVTGVQFRVTGIPEGWSAHNAVWAPGANMIAIGHPLFPSREGALSGVNLAWAGCRLGETDRGRFALGRIILLGAPTPPNVRLRVDIYRLLDTEPLCPIFTGCDAMFSLACARGADAILNGETTASCGNGVAVEATTWSALKSLYQ
jgi:hypothetical protein